MEKLNEYNEALIEELIEKTGLKYLKYGAGSDPKLKPKNSAPGKIKVFSRTDRNFAGVDFYITLNENIFDRLSDEHQKMVIERLLAEVKYDLDKDKVFRGTQDFQEHTGILDKYSYPSICEMRLAVDDAYTKTQEEQ